MGWMQTGRNSETDGPWASRGSKANLKSELKIISPTGFPIIHDNTEDGQQSWNEVPTGSTLEWKVNTDGHDDRVALKLSYWDMDKFLSAMNESLNGLSEEDRTRYESGDKIIEDEVAKDTIDRAGGFNRLFVEVWSDITTTESDGNLSGIIKLNPAWPKTLFFFNAHYGYAADEESSNASKTSWAALEAVGWAAMAVATVASFGTFGLISAGVATSIAGVAGAISTAAMVIEGGKFANKHFAIGYGPATENKYGDQFPILGFNQSYTFFVDDSQNDGATMDEWGKLLSDDNIALIDKANIAVAMIGITKIVIAGGLLLFILNKRKSG